MNRGRRLVELLKQQQFSPMDVDLQVVSIYAGTRGHLDSLKVESISDFEGKLHAFVKSEHPEILSAIVNTGKLEKDTEEALASAIKDFKDRYLKENTDAVAA